MNVEQSFPVEAGLVPRRRSFSVWVQKRRWFILVVFVPTILAALYYGLFASDVYVSESRFVVKSADQKQSQVTSLANLVQTTGLSGSQEQTNEILAYIQSRDALRSLEQNASIREKFSLERVDPLSRFPMPFSRDSFESLYKYYGKMVDASLDSETETAVIQVRAFSPLDAYQINRRLLDLSEAMVNRLNARAQTQGITEAQKQVEIAIARTRFARAALAQYRNSQSLIDPDKQAQGVLDITNSMITVRATLQAQLDLMQRSTPNNPSIPTLRSRINAISAQIASQDSRIVGTNSAIASKMGGFENIQAEQDFASQNLDTANAALVKARADALHKQFYLERIVDPNVPDMALLPKRLLNTIVVAAVTTLLYFIGWMFVVGILEHAPDE
jgi:capsular polysaccharide transport system permease protein